MRNNKDYIESVIVYFYCNGEYYALNRGRTLAYFPKVKIEKYSDEIDRDYINEKVFNKIFSSVKIDYTTFKHNIWMYETLKIKKDIVRIIRIDLSEELCSNIGLKFTPCKNEQLKVESKCYNIIREIERKHYSPIYISTLILGVFFTIFGIIAFWQFDPNSRLIDVTSFIMLISTILINGIVLLIAKYKKYKLKPIVNVGITFISLIVSLFISQRTLVFFENINTAALSIIAIGITLIISVIEYCKRKYDNKK